MSKRQTEGSEPSQYLEEEKTNSDSVSSGERTRKSPNLGGFGYWGVVGLGHMESQTSNLNEMPGTAYQRR